MRIGLAGARADRTGLSIQTHAFWRNMKPDATLLVDFTRFGFPSHWTWYASDPNVFSWTVPHYEDREITPTPIIDDFLDRADVVFSVETPYDYYLLKRARELGKRTVLQPNYEFLEYLIRHDIPEPDVFGLPTSWHESDIRAALPGREIVSLPVPVDCEVLPNRRRTKLDVALHIAGNVAQTDRAGTKTFIEAMRFTGPPVHGLIRCQRPLPDGITDAVDSVSLGGMPTNVTVIQDQLPNHADLFTEGDVFVLPRRYGGLCLPAQEALACGMPVIMPDVPPYHWLPDRMTLPATKTGELQTRALLDLFDVKPLDLSQRLKTFADDPELVGVLSDFATAWGETNSWWSLKPLYERVLAG